MTKRITSIAFRDLGIFLFVTFSTILNAYINYRNQVKNEKMTADLANLLSQSDQRFEKMFSVISQRLDKIEKVKEAADLKPQFDSPDSILDIIAIFLQENAELWTLGALLLLDSVASHYVSTPLMSLFFKGEEDFKTFGLALILSFLGAMLSGAGPKKRVSSEKDNVLKESKAVKEAEETLNKDSNLKSSDTSNPNSPNGSSSNLETLNKNSDLKSSDTLSENFPGVSSNDAEMNIVSAIFNIFKDIM